MHRLIAATALALAATSVASAGILPEPTEGDRSAYVVTPVAEGLNFPWSLAFLPDGSMLVSERNGGLRIIRDGKLVESPIADVPPAFQDGQGGYHDIIADPDFATNSFVYLAFAEGTDEANHTAVIRAKFDGSAFQDVTYLFRASPDKATGAHFGGRLAFLPDGTLLATTGDGFKYREQAQDRNSHLGKIVRLKTTGGAADDNPFVGQADAKPEVWSYGHRNVQGLAIDAKTGTVYESEHGALSGDEVNVITKGANYGWPIATYSVDYSGAVISPYTEREGTEQPIAVWKPERFAPSGLAVYRGTLFPQWDGDLLAGGLAGSSVRRLDLDENGKVVGHERLFAELDERIRDVRVGPDGAIYLVTDGGEGKVLKVTPAK